uniref:NADH-ubiquinone oxidoreductase chain 3 n=1 Tax=Figites sp. ZJUH 20220010 TaxID=2995277 RepID=A0A9E8G7F5_9HYME|nr:NADH dehydrogenase subunit 3 [Figites sp. ZJUH 20220010]
MFYMIFLNLLMILIGWILLMLNFVLSKKKMKNMNKITPFECGFDNMSMLRLPFSLQFYMISIIFLIFDVEISLIFPIIKSINLMNFYNNIFIIIVMILIFGLYYEWKEGSLEWLK